MLTANLRHNLSCHAFNLPVLPDLPGEIDFGLNIRLRR